MGNDASTTEKASDIGDARKSYTITADDIANGFTVEMDLYVKENRGPNAGQKAHFLVTFSIMPQAYQSK